MQKVLPLFLLMLLAAPSVAFDLEGHRGTRGLAPENTLAAFRRALDIGVTTIETDMGVTKDDVVVISHNPFLSPDLVRDPDGHWLAGARAADPHADLRRAAALRHRAHQSDEPVRAIVPGSAGGRRRALSQALRVVRSGQGERQAGAIQHRDQDHADQRREHARPRDVRQAGPRRGPRGERRRSRDLAIVRLAHAGRNETSRARDRDLVPDDSDGERQYGAASARRRAFAVARGIRAARPWRVAARRWSRPRAAAPGRCSGAI